MSKITAGIVGAILGLVGFIGIGGLFTAALSASSEQVPVTDYLPGMFYWAAIWGVLILCVVGAIGIFVHWEELTEGYEKACAEEDLD